MKERSDLEKGQPKTKSKQRSEEYLAYQRYIRSKAFKEVKKAVEERDGHKCMTCGRTRADGVQLCCHHRTYEHLFKGIEGGEDNDCITICKICHKGIHSMRSNYQRFKK